MSRPLRVAITGAGIAGLASAVFLARAGHRFSLFEKMPGIAGDGTGILLKPAGLDVLRRLGLAHSALLASASSGHGWITPAWRQCDMECSWRWPTVTRPCAGACSSTSVATPIYRRGATDCDRLPRPRPGLLCAPHLGVHQFEQLLWTQ